ncbi:MAG: heat-inducible transcription repressor HrcA [Erysipelotrichaceae bacterium]|nr:heat-inducible transcription repressor HrcA [Erysipelotrichaceae bacterium]MBQ5444090.1 heat-inducible transcription repressor HrcA [Erysipelotrichaceae bacterium]
MALTKRMVDILKAIVDEFVSTAEPVGSKTLVDKYDLPYSSATIRNDMATLESLGYLEKPHTSAGRIPSNKGYQYYCEHLLKKDMDEEVKYALSNIFDRRSANIEDAIKESCKIVSEMTNLASGMLGPDASNQTLEHIKVFQIDPKTAVCVFITNTGHTENKTFNFQDEVTIEDIQTCTDILNDRLRGTPIHVLPEKMESLKPILTKSMQRFEMLYNAFAGAFVKFASETLYFDGTSNMMYQPEYADIEKLKQLTKFFDDSKLFRSLVERQTGNNEVVAVTPKGTELVWKDDIAIVSSEIRISDNPNENARLMVVGPRRMEYNRVVNLLDFISKEIENMFH